MEIILIRHYNCFPGGRVGEWLARAGVDLRPGYVRWYSRALNPWFTRMGRNYPTFLRQWYAHSAPGRCVCVRVWCVS
jgi:hypothetical protein